MAHSLSSKKRIRQNVKAKARNRGRKAELKTTVRGFTEALAAGDPTKAAAALKVAVKQLDKTAAKKTIHKNTAARKKSRLTRKLNALTAAAKKS